MSNHVLIDGKYYSRRTANRLLRIQKKHVAIAKAKPVTASHLTSRIDSTGQFYNETGTVNPVKYKSNANQHRPVMTSKLVRNKDETIKLVCRKLNK